MITENKQDVKSLFEYIDKKILQLRSENILSANDLNYIQKFRDEYMSDWLMHIIIITDELSKEDEEYITDILLELITRIDALLDKK